MKNKPKMINRIEDFMSAYGGLLPPPPIHKMRNEPCLEERIDIFRNYIAGLNPPMQKIELENIVAVKGDVLLYEILPGIMDLLEEHGIEVEFSEDVEKMAKLALNTNHRM